MAIDKVSAILSAILPAMRQIDRVTKIESAAATGFTIAVYLAEKRPAILRGCRGKKFLQQTKSGY